MIEVYTWSTPNGRTPLIMLEEIGLSYRIVPVNLGAHQHHDERYLRLNPNGKVPTLIDDDGPAGAPLTLIESGAILIYLAEKSGKLLPSAGADRYATFQWLAFGIANVGPMFSEAQHFLEAEQDHRDAEERYVKETERLYGVLDDHLRGRNYFADAYSIADIAVFPWARDPGAFDLELSSFPHLARWIERVETRNAVRRALDVPMR